MKYPDRKIVSDLEALPNIGKAIAKNLRLIGIKHPKQLIGKDPIFIYEKLCEISSQKHDPCVLDVFMSAVDFMNGSEPRNWWEFTQKRKKILKAK